MRFITLSCTGDALPITQPYALAAYLLITGCGFAIYWFLQSVKVMVLSRSLCTTLVCHAAYRALCRPFLACSCSAKLSHFENFRIRTFYRVQLSCSGTRANPNEYRYFPLVSAWRGASNSLQ